MEDHGGATRKRIHFTEMSRTIHAYVDLQIESLALKPRLAGLPCLQAEGMAGLADDLLGRKGHSLITRFLPRGDGERFQGN
jgi:hypothetical protein